ncbi:MAG: hypothetical protein QNJ98_15830 [Planctomycetota bacterium]|nr:hypothetical protein [Planctomycetota bacterium]
MDALREELRRLGRHVAADQGGVRAARTHLALLIVAVVLAFVSRAVLPLPGLAALEGAWIPTLITAAVLYLLGSVLHLVHTRFIRPDLRGLALRLDDDHHWRDDTSTAMDLPDAAAADRVPRVLLAQTKGRLRLLDREAVRGVSTWGRRVRIACVLLFVCVLLLPGVDGLFDARGAGVGADPGLGRSPDAAAFGPPPPLDADWFLATFVEDPLPVEPLPEDAQPEEPGK